MVLQYDRQNGRGHPKRSAFGHSIAACAHRSSTSRCYVALHHAAAQGGRRGTFSTPESARRARLPCPSRGRRAWQAWHFRDPRGRARGAVPRSAMKNVAPVAPGVAPVVKNVAPVAPVEKGRRGGGGGSSLLQAPRAPHFSRRAPLRAPRAPRPARRFRTLHDSATRPVGPGRPRSLSLLCYSVRCHA